MLKPSLLRPAACVLGGALLLGGCANPMAQRSEHEERVERKLLDQRLVIETGEPGVLDAPQRRIRVHEQQTFEVTEFQITRRYDRSTPYQAWREAYEMPLGAVAIVAGLGANLVNVATFGQLPQSMTHGWLSYGVAGLNPFMNAPSSGRAEQHLAGVDDAQKNRRLEHSRRPWAKRPVRIQAGRAGFELTCDANGELRMNLLDGPFADQNLQQLAAVVLSVSDLDNNVHAMARLPLSANLRGKLGEARELIYADLEDDDVEQWVHRVRRLSQLGLADEASELEQSLIELTRNDPPLQREFVTALARRSR
jgi:hypothetical protein